MLNIKKIRTCYMVLPTILLFFSANAQSNVSPAVDPTQFLDHFMCYDVEYEVIPQDIRVRVKDQFLSQGYRVHDLVQLCAPAAKRHDNMEFEIKYQFAHLACYKVEPFENPSANATVVINNQFQKDKKLFVRRVQTICVPTLKEHLQ